MSDRTDLSAAQQFAAINGSAQSRNTQLAALCGVLTLLLGASLGLNYRLQAQASKSTVAFIRIDELGRYDVLDYDETTSGTPRPAEALSALRTFVIRHFSRRHIAVSRDFPESLFFLEPALVTKAKRDTEPAVKTFIGALNAVETDIVIKQAKLLEFNRPPFKAQIDFEQQYYQPGARTERKPTDRWTVTMEFEFRDTVPHDFVQVNPFGLQITYLQGPERTDFQ